MFWVFVMVKKKKKKHFNTVLEISISVNSQNKINQKLLLWISSTVFLFTFISFNVRKYNFPMWTTQVICDYGLFLFMLWEKKWGGV